MWRTVALLELVFCVPTYPFVRIISCRSSSRMVKWPHKPPPSRWTLVDCMTCSPLWLSSHHHLPHPCRRTAVYSQSHGWTSTGTRQVHSRISSHRLIVALPHRLIYCRLAAVRSQSILDLYISNVLVSNCVAPGCSAASIKVPLSNCKTIAAKPTATAHLLLAHAASSMTTTLHPGTLLCVWACEHLTHAHGAHARTMHTPHCRPLRPKSRGGLSLFFRLFLCFSCFYTPFLITLCFFLT